MSASDCSGMTVALEGNAGTKLGLVADHLGCQRADNSRREGEHHFQQLLRDDLPGFCDSVALTFAAHSTAEWKLVEWKASEATECRQ